MFLALSFVYKIKNIYVISKIRKFLDDNNNILISSLINFTFKNILVFFIIDILNFDPKKVIFI